MQKRLLSREEAASYTGTTARQFSVWVKKGIMPERLPETLKWDIRAIDAHLDKKSGLITKEKKVVDEWFAERDRAKD